MHGGIEHSFPYGVPEDLVGAIGHGQVFTRELRVRFLDHLAFMGNVRAAAARVGVSHETAYRARRQDAAFAALWEAALVHARSYGESLLATRALEGVEVPIVYHGEVTGYFVRHDPRLLLAHLGRLDRRVEGDAAALARAGRFDELLAGYAGHAAPADFAAAAAEALDWRERDGAPELPPTREAWVAWRRGEAIDVSGRSGAAAEARAMEAAGEAAGAAWDRWHGDALARVAAILRADAAAGEAPPVEYKSASGPGTFAAPDRVTGVNPRRRGRAGRLQLRCGAAVPAPYSGPVIA